MTYSDQITVEFNCNHHVILQKLKRGIQKPNLLFSTPPTPEFRSYRALLASYSPQPPRLPLALRYMGFFSSRKAVDNDVYQVTLGVRSDKSVVQVIRSRFVRFLWLVLQYRYSYLLLLISITSKCVCASSISVSYHMFFCSSFRQYGKKGKEREASQQPTVSFLGGLSAAQTLSNNSTANSVTASNRKPSSNIHHSEPSTPIKKRPNDTTPQLSSPSPRRSKDSHVTSTINPSPLRKNTTDTVT